MKKLIYILIAAALVSCGNAKNNNEDKSSATAAEAVVDVNIDDLIANGATYEGKVVKFSAVVNHVCRHSGSKLTVAGTVPDTYLKVMATEEVEKFDPELNGATVEVVGTVVGIQSANVEECTTTNNVQVENNGKVYVVNCKSVVKL